MYTNKHPIAKHLAKTNSAIPSIGQFISTNPDEDREKLRQESLQRSAQETESAPMEKINPHRTTIAPLKYLFVYSRPRTKDNKTTCVRYSLPHLDEDLFKAWLAMENDIKREKEKETHFKLAIVWYRDPTIPNGTLRSRYKDTDAFTERVMEYHKNQADHIAYLNRLKSRIDTMKQLGEADYATFMESVLRRAISF